MDNLDTVYSDYIVYVDESGDHSFESINPRYPLFVLAFCVFEKRSYFQKVIPNLSALKFSIFGHDSVVLHEQDIRKKRGEFSTLSWSRREHFIRALSDLVVDMEVVFIPIVIDKRILGEFNTAPDHIYHFAMQLGLEKLYQFLQRHEQYNSLTHVVFEARGRTEDLALELEFRRICNGYNALERRLPFDIIIANKKTNTAGLQIADIAARPIGLSVLRPDQPNHAFNILEKKLYQENQRERGPFVFPMKAKGPEVALEAQTPVG